MAGGYVSPYAARIAALTQQQQDLEAAPEAPMFSPEETARRQAQNTRNYQLGVLAQLSGDKVMGGVGEPVLKQALAERQRKVTDHGEYDPVTGQLKMFPEYKRQRTAERLAREQARLQEQEGRGMDQWERDRARAEDRAFQIRLAAANRPVQENWKFVGVDESDGKPILLNREGTFAKPGDKPGTFVHYTGQAPATRANAAKTTKELESLEDTTNSLKTQLTKLASPAGSEAYGTGVAGTVISKLPIFRGVAASALYTPEENKLRADIQAESYQQAVKIAGVAQTLGEKWRFEPFLVQPDDPQELVVQKLEAMHRKSQELMARKRQRMGMQPGPGGPTPTPQNPGMPQQAPGASPVINFDAQGNRIP